MLRRNKPRTIAYVPDCTCFRAEVPQGEDGSREEAEDTIIGLDMLEAMRLVDAENLSQQEAAARMNVSTPTLCRILAEARRRTIEALLGGCNIRLDGGNIMLTEEQNTSRGYRYGQGRHGQGRGQGFGQGFGHGRGGQSAGQGHGHGAAFGQTPEHCDQDSAQHEEGQRGQHGRCGDHAGGHGQHGHGAATVHYHYHYHCTVQPDQLPKPCCPAEAVQEDNAEPACEH